MGTDNAPAGEVTTLPNFPVIFYMTRRIEAASLIVIVEASLPIYVPPYAHMFNTTERQRID